MAEREITPLFDTHAHLTDSRFTGELEVVAARWREAGVTGVVCAGDTPASSREVLALSRELGDVYAAVGIHPESVAEMAAGALEEIRALAGRERVVAIGEIGLDYYWDTATARLQQEIFRRQLELACELGLPVLVHDREAHRDVLEILGEFPELPGVVMHCFSGDAAMAEECLRRGYLLGVGGTITYPKNGALRETISRVPLERLLLETDCPYLAPQPWRGRRNEPSYLTAVAERLAEIKGTTLKEVGRLTTINAGRFFGLEG